MKKITVLVSSVAVILILSNLSFAQSDDVPVQADAPALSIEDIIGTAHTPRNAPVVPQVLPFGYPPYPTVDGNPAFGVPYSYPRVPRRFGGGGLRARLAPPAMQPYPLPPVPAMNHEGPGAVPAAPEQPVVFYRPTPIKNFVMLMSAPRPYIGYDPYAGYPPFPGYVPPQ